MANEKVQWEALEVFNRDGSVAVDKSTGKPLQSRMFYRIGMDSLGQPMLHIVCSLAKGTRSKNGGSLVMGQTHGRFAKIGSNGWIKAVIGVSAARPVKQQLSQQGFAVDFDDSDVPSFG